MESAPEVIVLACCGFTLESFAADGEVLARFPGALDLPAVREGRVYATDGRRTSAARVRAWWRAWKSWRISCIRSCFLHPALRMHSRGSTSRRQLVPFLIPSSVPLSQLLLAAEHEAHL